MNQHTKIDIAERLMQIAEQLTRAVDDLLRTDREAAIDLQGVADAIRDAGLHAMHHTILQWLYAYDRTVNDDDSSRRRAVEAWFVAQLEEQKQRAEAFALGPAIDWSRIIYTMPGELIYTQTRCTVTVMGRQCELEGGHSGGHIVDMFRPTSEGL